MYDLVRLEQRGDHTVVLARVAQSWHLLTLGPLLVLLQFHV